eukprot:TRINITY_DN6000_c0_g3_i1.p1 TRINITY_DN6000_c0_g3~~TRINITY_DN6000_c0_g3_i1.p1  ORF type:complete len:1031 (-),score=176.15 TRINITY_DN6000_c0_g3_i1:48-3140(-)
MKTSTMSVGNSSVGNLPSTGSRNAVRPSSAGSVRRPSGSKIGGARPSSAKSTGRMSVSTNVTLASTRCSADSRRCQGCRPFKVCPRQPKGRQFSQPKQFHVWSQIKDPPSISWAEKWCTTVNEEELTASVPTVVTNVLQAMYRDAVRAGHRFLCVLECCHDCQDHARTTKHKPEVYERYAKSMLQCISNRFSFMPVLEFHRSRPYLECESPPRRVGACEIYLLLPEEGALGNLKTCQTYLVHTKLASLLWPSQQNVCGRIKAVMPAIVSRIEEVLRHEWTPAEGISLLEEAESWGLGSWNVLTDLAEKVRTARSCLQRGNKAHETKDKEALREALQQGLDINLQDDAMDSWRTSLKSQNLPMFSIKMQARRFRHNAAFAAAVRHLQSATIRPIRVSVLRSTIEKCKAAELPEEEISDIEYLCDQASEVLERLQEAVGTQHLPSIAEALDELEDMGVCDSSIDAVRSQVLALANSVRRAAEIRDLVELERLLGGWTVVLDPSSGVKVSQEYSEVLQAESVRARLQNSVAEVEKRLAAGRFEAAESAIKRLQDVHIQDGTWDRWMSVMQRERNFKVLKAISGASFELKRHLYAMRLESAQKAVAIPLKQLLEAADAAESHQVDPSAVARARAEATSVQQRWRTAQEAVSRRSVDTAEVMLWKLKASRVYMEEWRSREGPLWEMIDAVKGADASKDWQAMALAIEGWKEDKPGTEHEAFLSEDSPTRIFRSTKSRIGELHLLELRQEVNEALNCLGDSANPMEPEERRSELKRVAFLLREMIKLGWEITPTKSARLLTLLGKVKASGGREASVARLSASVLQMLEGSVHFVFLLDRSKPISSESFRTELIPAVSSSAELLRKISRGVPLWGAITYGPVEVVQELTPDFSTFEESVDTHLGNAGGANAVSKALKKALELFKARSASDESDRDPHRVVFNFTHGVPDSNKDAQKAFRMLHSSGVTVVTVGIGKDAKVEGLAKMTSQGLVFRTDSLANLKGFLKDAFEDAGHILEKSQSSNPEDILCLLDNSAESG